MKEYNEFLNEISLGDLLKVPKDQRKAHLDKIRSQETNRKSQGKKESTDKDVSALLSLLKKPIDWNYEYSDDHKIWRETSQRIQRIMSIHMGLSDEHKAKVAPAMKKAGFNVK